jgi:hypothetical protein
MLNYIQRISNYKGRSFFQVNGPYLDIYTGTLHIWLDDIYVAKDILAFASSIDLQDEYEILNVRYIGSDVSDDVKNRLIETLATANTLLADELGESETWASIKSDGSPKRHFLTISFVKPKEPNLDKKEIQDDKPKKRVKTIRAVPDSIEPV